MEIGLAVLLFVCMTALLYVILSLKITRQVDLQIKEFYKTRIHNDMKEFYRDMESYAAMFDTRIERFQTLMRRGEEVARSIDAESHVPQNPVEAPVVAVEAAAIESASSKIKKSVMPVDARRKTRAAAEPVAPAKGKGVKKTVVAPAVLPKSQGAHAKIAKPEPKKSRPEIPPKYSVQAKPAARTESQKFAEPAWVTPMPLPQATREPHYETADDSAIAEELMRDLFERDQLNLTPAGRENVSAPTTAKAPAVQLAVTSGKSAEENAPVKNFLSSIGKALRPMVFGETPQHAKPGAVASSPEAKPTIARSIAAAPEPAQSDFSAVLRRAEQIKAEKKAERERAEISARAEFYASGDNFQPRARTPGDQPRASATLPTHDELPRPALVRAEAELPVTPTVTPRNNLAVKELDAYTKGFLIESLVSDNGYRKQALRALTENNVTLDEIARLSKIDIGELELMRQLGRF